MKLPTLILLIIALSMANIPYVSYYSQPMVEVYSAGNFAKIGYRPVPEECPYPENSGKVPDNLMYKKWCEETFDNGEYIYEAYKDIAFNIKYTPEQLKIDNWQTPTETARTKKGDCEDAVLLFASHLPSNQENATITWGWIIDRSGRTRRAHVWYQLTDKKGQIYIVEGFSREWNGIMPLETVEKAQPRKPILTITHSSVSRLASLPLETDNRYIYKTLTKLLTAENPDNHDSNRQILLKTAYNNNLDYEFIENLVQTQYKSWQDTKLHKYPENRRKLLKIRKEISIILRKLHRVYLKEERQKSKLVTFTQISNKTDMEQPRKETNLR